MGSDDDNFYIAINHPDGNWRGFIVSPTLRQLEEGDSATSEKANLDSQPVPGEQSSFKNVFSSFRSTMSTYRSFLNFMIAMAPAASAALAERTISEFAKTRGRKREDLSNTDRSVFELTSSAYRQLLIHREEITAARRGAKHLPEVMLIGLVSAYDAFLGKLLRVVFDQHEELILTSEKNIKFSELSKFESIKAARAALIDREVESILRESHHEHFRWMEERFKMKLREGLPAFKKFVELCERRNLLTHTGGAVSAQYITNCKAFQVENLTVRIGDQLVVDADYYRDAVNVVCEIGTKLCYVLWRKFMKEERESADNAVNEFCLDLISSRDYATAEAILSFAAKCAESELFRRMMVINHANSVRLQKKLNEATKILDQHDWSAVGDNFRICVAAVRENVDEVTSLMKQHPSAIDAEDYRTWPVFRGLRTNSKFSSTYEEIFKQPLLRSTKTEVTERPKNKSFSHSTSPNPDMTKVEEEHEDIKHSERNNGPKVPLDTDTGPPV
ncbi:hypothetical protein BRAO375_2590001 [Bradyrhizobium sp. ORS 375]|uniref:hypothetical protein n=1 Tax=Bradyrhizobium sp. (strain ORS 375) TaxID=566679 RepID=UPI000240A1B9|nr:hypothetical protein [Bradyrhizobium sp. ORS 375]CCD93438.1 hypothetical protein BRAO375_2590001 [Bradyrhizobium sp. ORS 375]